MNRDSRVTWFPHSEYGWVSNRVAEWISFSDVSPEAFKACYPTIKDRTHLHRYLRMLDKARGRE